MSIKKTFKEKFRENYDSYYDKFVKPYDDEFEAIDEKIKFLEDNPEAALKNTNMLNVSFIAKKHRELKAKIEAAFRNLLLAHAGGAVLVINLIPDLMRTKEVLPLAVNALNNFAWGLILLLISAISLFVSEWFNNMQAIMKEFGGGKGPIVNLNLTNPLLFIATVCVLISLFLFASAILSAATELSNIIINEK